MNENVHENSHRPSEPALRAAEKCVAEIYVAHAGSLKEHLAIIIDREMGVKELRTAIELAKREIWTDRYNGCIGLGLTAEEAKKNTDNHPLIIQLQQVLRGVERK